MARSAGDFFSERLYEWGVRRVHGYQGVCIATSGPGASHLITGLYDAHLDHMPVRAIAGQQSRNAPGGQYQQEIDPVSLFKHVAGSHVHQASAPAQVRHLVDRAMRVTRGEQRVAAPIYPNDLRDQQHSDPPRKHGTLHSGVGYAGPKIVPCDTDLQRAADVLNAGQKVAILDVAGALRATDEVIAVADRLQAGAAMALLGKAALPDELPRVTGSIGLRGTKPSWDLMAGCDTLPMAGPGFPCAEFMPPEGQARGAQIDIKAGMLGLRCPMEVNLTGDGAETLRALLPLLRPKTGRSWRDTVEPNVAATWKTLEARAMHGADPVNPQRVAWVNELVSEGV